MCEPPIIYGIDLPARCLISLPSENDQNFFLVGTHGVRNKNELHVLLYDEEVERVSTTSCIFDRGEIKEMAANNGNHVAIGISSVSKNKVIGSVEIWEHELSGDDKIKYSTKIDVLDNSDNQPKIIESVNWSSDNLLVAYDNFIQIFNISDNCKSNQKPSEFCQRVLYSAFDPFSLCNVAFASSESHLSRWDLRENGLEDIFVNNNVTRIRTFDFNPNNQYYVALGCDDGKIIILDTRNTYKILNSYNNHCHWIQCVKYNPVHDQLLLTTGSDNLVCLHNSILDENKSFDDSNETSSFSKSIPDGLITRLVDHEDSVYSCAWGCADSWIFGTLSYDGRVNIYRINRDIKYNIMNL
ncbi:Protein TSSC1 [Strongyloides ratti]|uniref:Protein TSSC1 n=1 Tax=Strongyloides ratti TaxID=34506 RepID=A0A090LIC1_STRRB|nr:Protein TSSC1 [Strongyloides ratti]CEF67215.1 Protein TSSC1 [Strongyloides ratti]